MNELPFEIKKQKHAADLGFAIVHQHLSLFENQSFTENIFVNNFPKNKWGFIDIMASFLFPKNFPTIQNFSQILLNLSIDTIVAVGMMVLLISGTFDLSVGSVVAFSGCLAAYFMFFMGFPVPIAIILTLLSAIFIGFINGYLVAYHQINPMIQTLAMMGIVRGLSLLVSGASIQGLPYWFNAISQSKLLGIQIPIWYMLLIVSLFTFFFQKTVFFTRYYFIGGNEKSFNIIGN